MVKFKRLMEFNVYLGRRPLENFLAYEIFKLSYKKLAVSVDACCFTSANKKAINEKL